MKWICWECGRENHYDMLRAVQKKCPHCGGELKLSRAPLASSSHIAGFVLMFGGVFWGYDNLVDKYMSFTTYAVLSVLFALAVGLAMVLLGLSLYNREAVSHREGKRL
ncbi:MAG TPA: hypothetical protein H9839_07500 [Candidatus Intestinimonas stercorigallinarum]|nr:hypothetical protein [Candidatus Intestinimonas stercorigallinarum]